jgi:pilus assembly protein Flp/PilA
MGFKKFIKRFIQEEEGATAVEYAVMLVLIIIVCLVAITFVGKSASNAFNTVATTLNRTP